MSLVNADGDKISLFNDTDRLVASCEKHHKLNPVILKQNDKDFIPLSESELAMNMTIVLTYLRLTFIVAMTLCSQKPFAFISFFVLSVVFDAFARYISFIDMLLFCFLLYVETFVSY